MDLWPKKICFDNSSVEIIDGKEEVEIINDTKKKFQEPEIIIDAEKKKEKEPIETDGFDNDGVSGALLQTFVTKSDLKQILSEILSKQSGFQGHSSQDTGLQCNNNKIKKSNSHDVGNHDDETDYRQEIGTKGSGVFITLEQWNAVKKKATYTSMALGLSVAVFDSNTLIKSNYKGGKSKIKSEENVQYTALDSKKIDAIKETVRRKFKNTFDEAKFVTVINNKLAGMRRKARNHNVI
ncbi:GSCOCG00011281001-RA-CDS [Cotesia congregata]|nr:GSCOCG00011281001-RA-CDS [Cotesia congregata]